jgi:hypothetical protein
MQPNRDIDITQLAMWAPRIAYGLVIGVPRVPFIVDVPIQFTTSAVDAPPIVASFDNNLTQDTMIERVTYNLFQQNSFPGSPFQSLYFNQMKQSGLTGVGVQMQVFGGPKYEINDTYTDLGNLMDVLAVTWPQGWLLFKQSNVKVSAILTQTPVSVPYDVTLTFTGWQMLDKTIDSVSDQEARDRLRKMGIPVPDVKALLPQ